MRILRITRRRPSAPMVVACIALAIALGGTSYAAVSLPANSVGTPQLKKNAVNSTKVANFSLRRVDFKRGQLPRGPRGLQGLQGDQGDKGDKGEKGDIGPSNAYELEYCSAFFASICTDPVIDIAWADYTVAPYLVQMRNLAAGSYVFAAEATILGQALSHWRVDCSLRVPLTSPGWASGAVASVGDFSGYETQVTMPITFGAPSSIVIPEGASAGLKCIRTGGEGPNPKFIYTSIAAVMVGNVAGR